MASAMRISPDPTADEAAAIAAVIAIVTAPVEPAVNPRDDTLHVWVEASRRSAVGAGLQRGPWRLSGRIARRARA